MALISINIKPVKISLAYGELRVKHQFNTFLSVLLFDRFMCWTKVLGPLQKILEAIIFECV